MEGGGEGGGYLIRMKRARKKIILMILGYRNSHHSTDIRSIQLIFTLHNFLLLVNYMFIQKLFII